MAKSAKPTQKASKGLAVSPLAPKTFPKLPPLAGVRLATTAAGVRYAQRTDVLLALLAPNFIVNFRAKRRRKAADRGPGSHRAATTLRRKHRHQ